jgi:ElaB/YqjD/DUF883 family membrane-anchored ribosome-binding protein
MVADPVLSRELRSLQDEIAASQRARVSSPPDRPIANNAKAASEPAAFPANQPAETAEDEEEKLQGEFREFLDEATKFFDEAEKSVSAHPAASMVGALVVGILIGRLLGRR